MWVVSVGCVLCGMWEALPTIPPPTHLPEFPLAARWLPNAHNPMLWLCSGRRCSGRGWSPSRFGRDIALNA